MVGVDVSFAGLTGTRMASWRAPALTVAVSFWLALGSQPAAGAWVQGKSGNQMVTVASGARARVAPQTTATLVETLQIGTVVEELERASTIEKVGQTEDYWYRVQLPDGQQGWIFGGLLAEFRAERREEIYCKIAVDALKGEEPRFADQVDLVHFLERAAAEVRGRESIAGIELYALLALKQSLAAIPMEKREQQPYAEWIREQADKIVYSEPAGQWFVRSELFWQLEKKFHSLTIAERIAWEAANNPLPGECEDDLTCQFELAWQTDGRYLKLCPRGEHANQAVDGISQTAKFAIDTMKGGREVFSVPSSERGEFQKTIGELRTALANQKTPRAAAVIKQLEVLLAHYR
jgi:hypothetical protein